MRLKLFIVFLSGVFCAYSSFAQTQGELTQSRILILLDESSSMIQTWAGGKEKYKAADELILKLMDSVYTVNSQVEFSLRVFGHQSPMQENNCYDTKNEVPFAKENRLQMELRLDDIRPRGVTPIAYALKEAAQYDIVDEAHNAYSIILITDGGESCGGDICEVMNMLRKYKVYFKPYIVSLEDYMPLKATYACMGDYLQVTKSADIPKAVGTIVDAFRPILKITTAEYKQLQTIAATAPSVLNVTIPVINVTESVDSIKPPKPEPKPVPKPEVKPEPVLPKPEPKPVVHDTVVAVYPKPPKPEHKIKVDEVWVKPPADNIAAISFTRLNLFNFYVPPAQKLNAVQYVPAFEAPVVLATENISKVSVSGPKQFAILTAAENKLKTVDVPKTEAPITPLPVENITGISLAKPHPMTIAIPAVQKLHTVSAPEFEKPAFEELPVRPAPEKIAMAAPARPRQFATTIAPAEKLHKVAAPEFEKPAFEELPVRPAPEKIAGLATMKPVSFVTTITSVKKLKTVDAPEFEKPAFEEVPVRPAPEKIAAITAAKPKQLTTIIVAMQNVRAVEAPKFVKPAFEELPVRPAPETISRLTAVRPVLIAATIAAAKKLKTVQDIPMPPVPEEKLVVVLPKEKIDRLLPTRLNRFLILMVEDRIDLRKVPPMPPVKYEVAAIPPTTTKPLPTKKPETETAKKVDYKIENEDAKETTVEVYFTNGHGKFYTSTPQVLMLTPGTGTLVKKFYRTTDADGNPDPQTSIPVGTYDVALTERRSLMIHNVSIQPNKKNKITFIVKPASLSFQYAGAPNRPMTEFTAVVTERNKPQGRVQNQKCTEKLEYEPGNYHIVINTFPEERRNEDIDFDESVITIAQPGFAKFMTEGNLKTAVLYKRLGDKFEAFYTLDLTSPISQHLQIQPGEYQAHYQRGPANMRASEKVVPFVIKTTQETEITLQ